MADLEQHKKNIADHVRKPGYQPVKPKVIAKKLEVPPEEIDLFRKALKQLVKAGEINFGADHRIQRSSPGAGAANGTVTWKDGKAKKPKTERVRPKKLGDPAFLLDHAADEAAPEHSLYEPPPDASVEPDSDTDSRAPRKTRDDKARDKGYLVGTFRKGRAGAGYVRVDERIRLGKAGEVYIPARYVGDAVTGDRVSIRLLKARRDSRDDVAGRSGKNRSGRLDRKPTRQQLADADKDAGQIVRVLERSRQGFVGTYSDHGTHGSVLITGAEFPHPIVIRDKTAHNAVDQDQVAVEITRMPTQWEFGEGVITEVLGARGKPGVDTLFVMRQYELPDAFPEEVLEQAREEARKYAELKLDERIPKGRVDLTGLMLFTVDPKDAKDFDDAVSLEPLENGHRRLGVHIADVAHFVPIDSLLDREARERATSIYLPDRVLPMLPEIISNHLASLQPGQRRLARTCFIEYGPGGEFVGSEVVASVIHSKRRFTYEEIDTLLDEPKTDKVELTKEMRAKILEMRDFAMLLRGRRRKAGAIELSSTEVKLDLDKETGKVIGATRAVDTVSHQIIEEFMLAANQAVAFRLEDMGLPFLHRVHDPPPLDRIESLHEFLVELGIDAKNLENRYNLQALLEAVKDEPYAQAVHMAVLRSMSKAVYSPDEAGHFALAFEEYGHFTSPIRRYPDLTIHRTFDAIAGHRKPPYDFRQLVTLGVHCSERERRAEMAERDLIQLKLLHYFEEHPDRIWHATVTGVEEFGVFAQCKEFPLEGLLPREALFEGPGDYDRGSHTLVSRRTGERFRLGDDLYVRVQAIEWERKQVRWSLERHEPHPDRPVRKVGSRSDKGKKREPEEPKRRRKRL